ncbi:MAG TPA: drug/metabolite exporter YedA [Candidatus Binatia bacterium]|nr:drug/metabolite exporter YedA [Candidatus Binatia bacterium]
MRESERDRVPRLWVVAACLIAVYLIWGSTYLAIRIAIESLPPMTMAAARFLVAGLLMLAALMLRGSSLPPARACANAAVIGVLLLAGGNGAVTIAEQWVSSSVTAAMVASGGVWSVVFLAAAGERTRPMEWLGVAIAFAGVIVLNLDGDLRAHPLGAALLVGATISWAIGSVLSRRLALPDGAMAAAIEMIAGGAVMLGVGVASGESVESVTTRSLAAWLYLVVFGSIVAFSAFTFLIRNVRPALATSYAYVNPAVALFLGVAAAGENVGTYGYAGVAVIVGGVAVLTLTRSTSTAADDEVEAEAEAPLAEKP